MSDPGERARIGSEIERRTDGSDPFAAAVRATRMPMVITDPARDDNPIIFVNDAFVRLTGYAREEILGRNCRFLQGPDTDRGDVAKVRDAVARRASIEIELLNYKKGGGTFWNRLLVAPVFDGEGGLLFYFASQFDVTRERARIAGLQEDRAALEQEVVRRADDDVHSEARLRFMLEAGRFGAWSLDLPTLRLATSDICKENFGRSPDDPFTHDDLVAAVHPDDRARMLDTVRRAIDERVDYDIEYRVLTPGGAQRWVMVRGQTRYRADGRPLSMAGVSIDVSERKRGEAHRALLVDELNHRVKNAMATMQSIAFQTLRNAASLEEAQASLSARLQSLAAAHDVLTRESWSGATLAEIVDGALRPFQDGAARRFAVGGPPLRLTPPLALAFAMALHELATNAVKYGALSAEAGRVLVSWEVIPAEASGSLWFRWEEVDGPPVAAPKRQGFGTRLIKRALAAEIDGTAAIAYRAEGLVFTLEAPLPEGGGALIGARRS